ncbi:MAG: hypothetical protein FJ319_11485 [SAR202 cluster bacterium]|nr:hypothetical protein [SAR202 cluster bacterium]
MNLIAALPRFAWLFVAIGITAIAFSISSAHAAPQTQTGQVLVLPINAQLERPLTTYTVEFANPQSLELSYKWTGPDCGTFPDGQGSTREPSGQLSFTWSHPHPPCDPTVEHDHVTITLLVTHRTGTITCTYRGASTGEGAPCKATEAQAAPPTPPASAVGPTPCKVEV